MPKILIFLAVWKRPEITEICFMGIDRLRKSGLFPIEALAVISEESMISLCEKYGIRWTFHENQPLGKKKNYGIAEAMKLEWDYLMEIGSDDVLYTEILEAYKPMVDAGEKFFGMKQVAYIDSKTGDCRKIKTDTAFGMGRMIHRSVIEEHCHGVEIEANMSFISLGRTTPKGKKGFLKVKDAQQMEAAGIVKITGMPTYKLWKDDINQSMDNNSTFFLATQGVFHKGVAVEKPMGIDIKSDVNIWPYNNELGTAHDLNEAIQGLSTEEQAAIFNLVKRGSNVEYQVTV